MSSLTTSLIRIFRLRSALLMGLLFSVSVNFAQGDVWITLVAKDANLDLSFTQQQDGYRYAGNNQRLSSVLQDYTIHQFKKVRARNASDKDERTYFVRTDDPGILDALLRMRRSPFQEGHVWSAEEKRIYQPNDYGLTSTIGANSGLPVVLDYLDFLGLPQAWYYTTGNPEVKVGIADAAIDTTNLEFKGKVKVYQNSTDSNGHGSGVAAIIAAQGDNGYGIPGLCYDCDIAATRYGFFKDFKQLRELSEDGVRVINCSFVSSAFRETGQAAIDTLFMNGTIVVGGAGNQPWSKTKGERRYYPASYDKAISVSAVMYKYEDPMDNLLYENYPDKPYVANARGFVGRTAGFKSHQVGAPMRIYHVSTATLNPDVDLLAPTVGVFRYPAYMLENKLEYIGSSATSVAAPFVTGTIGLMLSLYPCLPVEVIEPILKVTATNIDHLKVNEPFKGNYGAGIVHAGRAVKLVHDLYNPEGTAIISGQRLGRWDFPLEAFSQEVRMEDQHFTGSARVELKAKNRIVLGPGTVLRPDANGSSRLYIDPDMAQECSLQPRSNRP